MCDSFCLSSMYLGCFMHWCIHEGRILIQLGVLSTIHVFWEGWLWVMKINSNLPRNIGCWLVCTISWNCSMLFIFLVLWVGWVIWLEAMVFVCQSEHTRRSWEPTWKEVRRELIHLNAYNHNRNHMLEN